MSTLLLKGAFIASKVGKTGLSPTVNLYRIALADGTSSKVVSDGAATEVGDGVYVYRYASADCSLYEYVSVFKTADSSVDQQHVHGQHFVMPDELTSSRASQVSVTALATILTGITSLAAWLRGLFRKDALDATAKSEINTGGGAFDEATDSLQAIRDTAPLGTVMRGTDGAYTGTPPSAADIKTALEADGGKLDHLWEMTEDDGGVRRLTANALEEAPGATAAEVWAASIRTLTTPAQTAETQAEAGALEIVRGVTWNVTLSGVSFPATWVACLFTVKGTGYKDDADDSGALLQVRLSKPTVGTDGLLRLGGSAATAALGSITASEAGSTLALTLDDGATIELATRTGLTYDVKFLLADGSSVRERIGTLAVVATPTVTRG